MEISHIHILESFPLVSIVMPYYGATHKMFLLLSEFSKQTRLILIDYYNEFRRYMFDYNQKRWITIKDLSKLCIPWDFFLIHYRRLLTCKWRSKRSDKLNKYRFQLILIINLIYVSVKIIFTN